MTDDPRQCWDYIALGIEEGIIREFQYCTGRGYDMDIVVHEDSLPSGLSFGGYHKFEYEYLCESEMVAPIRVALESWGKLPEGW
nr:hypothetical protein [uncultured bacterium]AMP54319.1 hypothetical protein [uncultured bacterium]AMP54355.1 hypothetical protein [uncultured bacterium]